MKNQKGITLIALVITIIVMLILVAVTVTIAMDGGLFTKAKTAGDDTKKEAEREELTSIVLGTYDGVTNTVDLTIAVEKNKDTVNNITTTNANYKFSDETKWEDVNTDNITTGKYFSVKGKKSGTTWYVLESGTVTDVEPKN